MVTNLKLSFLFYFPAFFFLNLKDVYIEIRSVSVYIVHRFAACLSVLHHLMQIISDDSLNQDCAYNVSCTCGSFLVISISVVYINKILKKNS